MVAFHSISFYFKNNLKKHIQVVEKKQTMIWIKIDRKLFEFNDDVFICHVYMPPSKTFQTKVSHIEHTKTHNEWFDIDCNTARRDFNTARNNFNRVKNDEARRNFTRARTHYNKVKKKAKQKFKIQEGQRISKFAKRDKRKFWKSLRKTFKKKQDEADSLTVHDLHEHFKSVFGESDENGDDNINPNTYNTNEQKPCRRGVKRGIYLI